MTMRPHRRNRISGKGPADRAAEPTWAAHRAPRCRSPRCGYGTAILSMRRTLAPAIFLAVDCRASRGHWRASSSAAAGRKVAVLEGRCERARPFPRGKRVCQKFPDPADGLPSAKAEPCLGFRLYPTAGSFARSVRIKSRSTRRTSASAAAADSHRISRRIVMSRRSSRVGKSARRCFKWVERPVLRLQ
jgi:hypothetical protein